MYFLYCLSTILIIILFLIKYNETETFTSNMFSGLTNNSDTPWTIEKSTKLIITDILRKIINMINKQTNMVYVFTTYDQLSQEVLCPMKTRYIADFFVHEMRNLETRKFIIKFVINFSNKQVNVEYINLSNAFKMPEKQFMNYPAPELILQDDNLLNNKYHIMGLNKSNLDFSILKDELGYHKQAPMPLEFQKWILPLGIAQCSQNPQALFPSNRQSKYWDTNGANLTIHKQRNDASHYTSMFDLVNSSGIGRGVARSP